MREEYIVKLRRPSDWSIKQTEKFIRQALHHYDQYLHNGDDRFVDFKDRGRNSIHVKKK